MGLVRSLAGAGSRQVGRSFGDAHVGGHQDRQGDRHGDRPGDVPLALRALQADRLARHEDVLEQHRVRTGPAHSQRVPVVEDSDALGVEGHREVEHAVPEPRARDHQVRARGPTREHLPGVDAIAAVDLGHLAVRVDPVRGAGADEHELLGCDAAEQRLRGQTLAEAPHGRRHEVGVHRERERRGRAVVGQYAHGAAQLLERCVAAPELTGHEGGEEAVLREGLVRLGDEAPLPVVSSGRLLEQGADLPGELLPFERLRLLHRFVRAGLGSREVPVRSARDRFAGSRAPGADQVVGKGLDSCGVSAG